MCGIAAVMSHDGHGMGREAVHAYGRNKGRGKEGFGVIAIRPGTAPTVRRTTEEALAVMDMAELDAPVMLVHNRLPTSTKNEPEQCHPFLVSHDELEYDWLVMHNGVVSNDDELAEAHKALGYAYASETRPGYFNDSEPMAVAFARFMEGKGNDGPEGYAAILAVSMEKATKDGYRKPVRVVAWRCVGATLGTEEADGVTLVSSTAEHAIGPDTVYEWDPSDPGLGFTATKCAEKLMKERTYGKWPSGTTTYGRTVSAGTTDPFSVSASAWDDADEADARYVQLFKESDKKNGLFEWPDGEVVDIESGVVLFKRKPRLIGNGRIARMGDREWKAWKKVMKKGAKALAKKDAAVTGMPKT